MKMTMITLLSLLLAGLSEAAFGAAADRMVHVPAGEFIMGNDAGDIEAMGGIVAVDETPKRRVSLKAFAIDRYEVTNSEYKAYLDSLKAKGIRSFSHYNDEGIPIPDRWERDTFPAGEDDFPVVDVDWYMANKYCEAQGKRLPTEEEWEKAARGADGRIYPWGSAYRPGYANVREGWQEKGVANEEWKAAPVGTHARDISPYGAYDMAGNIQEWTSSLYRAYPGSTLDRAMFRDEVYVIRGGAFNTLLYEFGRTTARHLRKPTDSNSAHAGWHSDMNLGMRCARDAE